MQRCLASATQDAQRRILAVGLGVSENVAQPRDIAARVAGGKSIKITARKVCSPRIRLAQSDQPTHGVGVDSG